MVQLTFVKPNVSGVQAILTCLIPESGDNIRYSVQSKRVLEDIMAGQAAIGPETCRACMEFGAFNYTLFGEESELYKDLTCEACFPEQEGGQFRHGNELLERSCQTVQTTYCIWDQPSGPLPTVVGGSGGGSGGDGGGWFTWSPTGGGYLPGDLVFIGPFGGGNDGSGGSGGGGGSSGSGGINLDGFVSGIFGGISSFFRDLFTRGPKCPKWKFTEPNGDLTARNGDVVYVCQTFTNIMCYNGGWWEVVESWPCPECDGNLTLEEYHAMQCSDKSLAFMAEYNVSLADLKKNGIKLIDCCEEGTLDSECGMRKIFTSLGLNEEEIHSIFTNGVQDGVMLLIAEYGFEYLQEHSDVLKRAIECSEDLDDMKAPMELLVFPQDSSNCTQIIQYIKSVRDACANRCTDYGYFEEFLTNWLYVVDTNPAAVSVGEIYDMGLWAKKLRDKIVSEYLLAFGLNILDVLEVAAWEYDLFVAQRYFSAVPSGARNWGMSRMLTKLNAPVSSFSTWQYAQKFGINSYDDLVKLFKDMGWSRTQKGVEFHHLVEQRFAGKAGVNSWLGTGNTGQWNSIVLTQAEHTVITNQWRYWIPYENQAVGPLGVNTINATSVEVKLVAKEIYKNYPEILSVLGL